MAGELNVVFIYVVVLRICKLTSCNRTDRSTRFCYYIITWGFPKDPFRHFNNDQAINWVVFLILLSIYFAYHNLFCLVIILVI